MMAYQCPHASAATLSMKGDHRPVQIFGGVRLFESDYPVGGFARTPDQSDLEVTNQISAS